MMSYSLLFTLTGLLHDMLILYSLLFKFGNPLLQVTNTNQQNSNISRGKYLIVKYRTNPIVPGKVDET